MEVKLETIPMLAMLFGITIIIFGIVSLQYEKTNQYLRTEINETKSSCEMYKKMFGKIELAAALDGYRWNSFTQEFEKVN